MLKLPKILRLKSPSIKAGVILPLILGGLAFTPMSAFALDITLTKYSTSFNRTSLQSLNGIENAYKKLEKKAKRVCRLGQSVNDSGEMISEKECVSDLLDQFIQSASVAPLTEYHMKKNEIKT